VKNKEITQRLCPEHSLVEGLGLRKTEVVLYFAKYIKVSMRIYKDKLKFNSIKPQIRRRQWLNLGAPHVS